MRIGIVSDIHTNAAGLTMALELMGSVHEVVCVGDAIYQYRFSNEVIGLLRQCGAHVILGNHEETLLGRDGERARSAPTVDREQLAWLAEQPTTIDTVIDGRRLYAVHGSPWEPFREYVYPSSPALHRFQDFDADYVLLGHTHFQMTRRVGRSLVINPGSAGDARDHRNAWRLSFAVLDTATDEVRICNFPDPARPVRLAADGQDEGTVWTSMAIEG